MLYDITRYIFIKILLSPGYSHDEYTEIVIVFVVHINVSALWNIK